MKKRVFSLVLALLVCAVLIPAPEAHAAPNTINVYNLGQYISDGTDGYIDINAAFEEATGIHVNYMTFDSNETMYTKLKTGGSSYDVIIPSDYMVGRLIDEGLLLPLNFDNIPNYQYMDEAYKNTAYDPDNLYSVPYTWGTVGIIYNSAYVDEEDVGSWDLLIIDVMMPRLDGIRATLKIREKQNMPIIILSAKSEDADKILGLNVGADDYMTKPFNPLELTARVKSQLRRYTQLGSTVEKENQAVYTVGGLMIDDDQKEITVDGEPVKLTPIEYNILLLLVKNQGKVFSIDQIYESIWNEDAIGVDNTVAVHIRHIREKIEINPKEPRYLKVVWGVGYKIEKL